MMGGGKGRSEVEGDDVTRCPLSSPPLGGHREPEYVDGDGRGGPAYSRGGGGEEPGEPKARPATCGRSPPPEPRGAERSWKLLGGGQGGSGPPR